MKTSNKLLAGFLLFLMAAITALAIGSRYYLKDDVIVGSGDIVTETRTIGSFRKVKSGRGVMVYLSQGPTKVEVKTYGNVMPEVETKVEDGTLIIYAKKRISISDENNRIRVYVTMPALQHLMIASGGYAEMENTFTGENLEVECSSGSNLKMSLGYVSLKCNVNSGAVAELKGQAASAEFSSSSGSIVKAEELRVGKCTIDASSGAMLLMHITEEVSGMISSGASIEYLGNPDAKNLQISSGGSVKKKSMN